MPADRLISTKKCPNCQQWSDWEQQPSDRCTHCGALLDPLAHAEVAQRAAAAQQPSGIQLIEINPEDGPLLRFFKTIVRGGQLLFIAILGFLVWFVTIVTG